MKKITSIISVLLLAGVISTGCYTHTYRTGLRPAQVEADHSAWHNHIIGGLITLSDDLNLEEICPNGTAVVHNRVSFVNALVSGVTFGIYTPTLVRVWCAAGSGHAEMHEVEVDISPELIEQARLIVPDFDEQLMHLHAELNAGDYAMK